MQSESEFDKEKALLDQKIEHLETTVETLKSKEKEQSAEIKSQKKELMSSLKDNSAKFENEIKDLKEKYETASENLLEKEADLVEKEQQYSFDKK